MFLLPTYCGAVRFILISLIATGTILSCCLPSAAATLPAVNPNVRVLTTVPAGHFPVAVSIDWRTHEVYVPNNSSADVTVIDESTNTPPTVDDIPGAAANGVATNPSTHKTYVANSLASNILVIDAATRHRRL